MKLDGAVSPFSRLLPEDCNILFPSFHVVACPFNCHLQDFKGPVLFECSSFPPNSYLCEIHSSVRPATQSMPTEIISCLKLS
jgi:hypothetical protein